MATIRIGDNECIIIEETIIDEKGNEHRISYEPPASPNASAAGVPLGNTTPPPKRPEKRHRIRMLQSPDPLDTPKGVTFHTNVKRRLIFEELPPLYWLYQPTPKFTKYNPNYKC